MPSRSLRHNSRPNAKHPAPFRPRGEPTLAKAPTGIPGLDAITGGGLPRGRPTLVCGAAGCGKTLLAMEFLVRGVLDSGEPGVFMAFEETPDELSQNVRSLGFDVDALAARGMISVDHVQVDPREIEETGDYDLEGLFIRLGSAIDAVGAKRVVLDTLEVLFASFRNEGILRGELRRLFRWLKDQGGHRDHHGRTGRRDTDATRSRRVRLRLRHPPRPPRRSIRLPAAGCASSSTAASSHGTNEYPFLISEDGIEVLPITSVGLRSPGTHERLSTGVPALDEMLGGRGLLPGLHRSRVRNRRIRKVESRRADGGGGLPREASAVSTSRSRNRRPRSCATCARSASISTSGSATACFVSSRRDRRCSAWRRT